MRHLMAITMLAMCLSSNSVFGACAESDTCKADPIGDPNGTNIGAIQDGPPDRFGNQDYTVGSIFTFTLPAGASVGSIKQYAWKECKGKNGSKLVAHGAGLTPLVNDCGARIQHTGVVVVTFLRDGRRQEDSNLTDVVTTEGCGSKELGSIACFEK